MLAPVLLTARPAASRPLWPGALYTTDDRAKAILRGIDFIYRTAIKPGNFADYGDDYLWCFYSLSATTADAELKRRTWRMGCERARQWRRDNRHVPANASADDIASFAYGSYAADCLGFAMTA